MIGRERNGAPSIIDDHDQDRHEPYFVQCSRLAPRVDSGLFSCCPFCSRKRYELTFLHDSLLMEKLPARGCRAPQMVRTVATPVQGAAAGQTGR